VAKSWSNYFCPEFEPLYERNKVTARGRYICEFPNRDKGHNNEAPVVRPDTPATPGATGPEERPATPVTFGAPVEGVPADGSPEPSHGRLPQQPQQVGLGENFVKVHSFLLHSHPHTKMSHLPRLDALPHKLTWSLTLSTTPRV